MAEIIANRYATALFDIAFEKGAMLKFEEEARMILKVLADEADYLKLLSHPSITEEQKIELVEKAFAGQVSEEFIGLIALVIKKARTEYLVRILEKFISMAEEAAGVLKATVISAKPLTNQQLAQIKAHIENNTGKTVVIEEQIDASIIGGLIVRVGDKVVDGSIKGQMDALKAELNSLRLA